MADNQFKMGNEEVHLVMLGERPSLNEKRDAIHIAVAVMIANETLQPGDHVQVVDGDRVRKSRPDQALGVVDPFLTKEIKTGERFWMMLNPYTITSLRHEWTHPAFPDVVQEEKDTSVSQQWVLNYSRSIGLGYQELMDAADDWVQADPDGWGEYLNKGELLDGVSTDSGFWEHYENITGRTVPSEQKHNFFTCAC